MGQTNESIVEDFFHGSHASDGILVTIADVVAHERVDHQKRNIIRLITCERLSDGQNWFAIGTIHGDVLVISMVAMIELEQTRVEWTCFTFDIRPTDIDMAGCCWHLWPIQFVFDDEE